MHGILRISSVVLLLALAPAALHAQNGTVRPAASLPEARLIVNGGDILRVQVWPDREGLYSGDFLVEETGLVHVPVLGAVTVGGKELDEVRAELRRRYAQVNENAVVAITPLFSVSVMGAVASPGMYPLRPGQTVFDAISLAGGFGERAKTDDVRLLRNGTVTVISAEEAFETGTSDLGAPVQSGDRILVPQRRGLSLLTVLSLGQTAVLLYSLIKGS